MKNDNLLGLIIIFGIIGIALISSNKSGGPGLFSNNSNQNKDKNIEEQLDESNQKAIEIQKQIDDLKRSQVESKYKGLISISYVSRSSDPGSEYITIRANLGTTTAQVTGWTLKSLSTGFSVKIPKGMYLYFSNSENYTDNIFLKNNDTLYLISGVSPLGSSFELNKCSGYLSQFKTFTPYISTSCPSPRNMDLSGIPNRTENDDCFDYIDSFPSCRIQTDPLPNSWSYECKKFITEKIGYSPCVYMYKNDKDFYQGDWRVYLGRSTGNLWKNRREDIQLLDNEGKIVDEIKY